MREFPPTKPIPPPPACLRGAPPSVFLFKSLKPRFIGWGRREFVGGNPLNKGFSMIRLLGRVRHPPKFSLFLLVGSKHFVYYLIRRKSAIFLLNSVRIVLEFLKVKKWKKKERFC